MCRTQGREGGEAITSPPHHPLSHSDPPLGAPDLEPHRSALQPGGTRPAPPGHLHSEPHGQASYSDTLPHPAPAGAISQGPDRAPLPPVCRRLPSYVRSPASRPVQLRLTAPGSCTHRLFPGSQRGLTLRGSHLAPRVPPALPSCDGPVPAPRLHPAYRPRQGHKQIQGPPRLPASKVVAASLPALTGLQSAWMMQI
ncbi:hypothetical protein NDU88_002626 [Pleurodeles waltl]|uniref:Uncharacterized protein n=1 Tax=Pleurodeles waltl TaxID=8319 RepID=A0AAV7MNN5_PLEWA|nr:hypothetical protein NDU88_002626 [Pleurodeles waltl]